MRLVTLSQRLRRSGADCGAGLLRAASALVFSCLLAAAQAAQPTDIILVLDNSGSMRKNDPDFLLKRAVSKFVNEFDSSARMGMVIFDEKVSYAVGLNDLNVETRSAIQKSLESIDYRGQLTNSPAAIERAIYELKTTGREDAGRIIVFMTDGIVDTGNPAADAEKTKWMRDELALEAAESETKIFGIAFTENADFFLIQSLAKKTNGDYFRALTPEDLAGVFAAVQEKLAAVPEPIEPEPELVAGPASVVPAPPVTDTSPLGGRSCLDTLPAEERQVIEESAPDVGVTAEALCREMEQASAGTVVVHEPTVGSDAGAGRDTIIIAALAVLAVLVLIAIVLLLRRRGAVSVVADAQTAPVVPEAFLKDLSGVAEDPAVKIGDKPLVIGRVVGSDAAHLDYFVINQGTVGRRHALIQYRDFVFWLSDQGSVNGTFLNGERIDGERQLKHGDRIKFHKYEFEFAMPEMDDAGHTVFADPNQATMIGLPDVDATVATAAPERPPEPPLPRPAAEEPAAATEFFPENEPVEPATIEPMAPVAAETDFDAEAAGFFDEADFASPPAAVADGAQQTAHGTVSGPAHRDAGESATVVPDAADATDSTDSADDISLDDFMRTDSFDTPLPGFDEAAAESEDATLMPDQVTSAPDQPPSIDDVFDPAGDRPVATNPSQRVGNDDDEERPDDARPRRDP